MASFYFDGNKLRIYEVPTSSTYTVTGSGYRIYTPTGMGEAIVRFDVQRDLWSRFQDWVSINSWSTIAFTRSGGAFRGFDEIGNPKYQTNDFQLVTSLGWRIVLANYPHETIFRGNIFANDTSSLFDNARITATGVVSRIEGYDSLQSYFISTGDGALTPTQAIQLNEIHARTQKVDGLIENSSGNRFTAKALEQAAAGSTDLQPVLDAIDAIPGAVESQLANEFASVLTAVGLIPDSSNDIESIKTKIDQITISSGRVLATMAGEAVSLNSLQSDRLLKLYQLFGFDSSNPAYYGQDYREVAGVRINIAEISPGVLRLTRE